MPTLADHAPPDPVLTSTHYLSPSRPHISVPTTPRLFLSHLVPHNSIVLPSFQGSSQQEAVAACGWEAGRSLQGPCGPQSPERQFLAGCWVALSLNAIWHWYVLPVCQHFCPASLQWQIFNQTQSFLVFTDGTTFMDFTDKHVYPFFMDYL